MAWEGRARGAHGGAPVTAVGRGLVGAALALALAVTAAPAAVADHTHPSGRTGDRPSAVGLDSHSRTYVGFVEGTGLARISRSGKRLKPWSLPGSGIVAALDVTQHDRVWVTDGRTARLIGRDGKQEKSFLHGPDAECPNTKGHRTGRYGGIESYKKLVFVANRCAKSVEVFKRSGTLLATIPLPGKGYPRGLAFDPGAGKRHAKLYVAMPDRRRVLVLGGEAWKDGEDPVARLRIRKPGRGRPPAPAGVVVDRFGQLIVSDLANNALYFYDSTHSFSRYRVLGHPIGPGKKVGHLHRPTGLAQHKQDGTRSAGVLVIADARNGRVQRWSTYGYTYWSRVVRAGKG